MLKRIKFLFFVGLVVFIGGVLAALWLLPGTFSAKSTPPEWEVKIARFVRHLATPSQYLKMANPIQLTSEVFSEARHHFADHCATCHANDGSGKTAMGSNFYPPVPDLRDPVIQSMADGELFYIIHSGIRFTGMPAWGKGPPEEDMESWKLVHFIRYLPRITPEDISEMKKFNPLTPQERAAENALDQFLSGEDVILEPDHHH